MRLVDTHCHLDAEQFSKDIEHVLAEALECGVERVIVPGTSVETTLSARDLAGEHENVYFAMGVHPHDADGFTEEKERVLRRIASESDKLVAVGEVGLDYYKNYSDEASQKKVFRKMCVMAKELDLPVIVHSREAFFDVFAIIDDVFDGSVRGQMHCFGGDEKDVRGALERGMHISFAPNVTYEKNRHLRELVNKVPVERLLLETDGPYLAPKSSRGERNDPKNVKSLLSVYAEQSGLSERDIARMTSHNANVLFSLGFEEERMIAYSIRSSLYLNITNRCTNRCSFCTRCRSPYVKGHRLDLLSEPSVEEIKRAVGGVSEYSEIVFCGFGEPTLRSEVVKEIAGFVKDQRPSLSVRLVTNGHGNLIMGCDIAEGLSEVVDSVSVSVNAPEEKRYCELVNTVFSGGVLKEVYSFAEKCIKNGISVEFTALDILSEEDLEKISNKAVAMGATLRVRKYNEVG